MFNSYVKLMFSCYSLFGIPYSSYPTPLDPLPSLSTLLYDSQRLYHWAPSHFGCCLVQQLEGISGRSDGGKEGSWGISSLPPLSFGTTVLATAAVHHHYDFSGTPALTTWRCFLPLLLILLDPGCLNLRYWFSSVNLPFVNISSVEPSEWKCFCFNPGLFFQGPHLAGSNSVRCLHT